MNYHHEKMKEINRTLSDFWKITYKGTDIETIMIKTDAEKTESNARLRSYNYRIVLKTYDDCELDMKGRCSAGQKVLSSIIIRLSLAETFCANCGILALDEPTTNLDNDNIEGLATALLDIIEARKNQNSF
jgi:DNA repair protein RAD50